MGHIGRIGQVGRTRRGRRLKVFGVLCEFFHQTIQAVRLRDLGEGPAEMEAKQIRDNIGGDLGRAVVYKAREEGHGAFDQMFEAALDAGASPESALGGSVVALTFCHFVASWELCTQKSRYGSVEGADNNQPQLTALPETAFLAPKRFVSHVLDGEKALFAWVPLVFFHGIFANGCSHVGI